MCARWICLGLALACFAPPLRADESPAPAKKDATSLQIPYRLTDTQHILVRVKLNGKGPFNFIIDTGAPLLYVTTAVGKKVGLKADDKGWAVLDRFEIEGGAVQTQVKCRVETPFQLEGMNSMGLAGAELHGIIGFAVLARYRMAFDFTRDKMTWTRLDFNPPAPRPVGGAKEAVASLQAMGAFMKVAAAFIGTKKPPEQTPRGFLGMELFDLEGAVTVKSVLPGSPAAVQGIKPGDRVARIGKKAVGGMADVQKLTAKVMPGDIVRFTVVRGIERVEIAITATKGL